VTKLKGKEKKKKKKQKFQNWFALCLWAQNGRANIQIKISTCLGEIFVARLSCLYHSHTYSKMRPGMGGERHISITGGSCNLFIHGEKRITRNKCFCVCVLSCGTPGIFSPQVNVNDHKKKGKMFVGEKGK